MLLLQSACCLCGVVGMIEGINAVLVLLSNEQVAQAAQLLALEGSNHS